jgi:hypothetical protein
MTIACTIDGSLCRPNKLRPQSQTSDGWQRREEHESQLGRALEAICCSRLVVSKSLGMWGDEMDLAIGL